MGGRELEETTHLVELWASGEISFQITIRTTQMTEMKFKKDFVNGKFWSKARLYT